MQVYLDCTYSVDGRYFLYGVAELLMRENQGLIYVIQCNLGKVEHETMLANGLFHLWYVKGLRAFAGHS